MRNQVRQAVRTGLRRAASVIVRGWRPILFGAIAVTAAVWGFILKPDDARPPAAQPGVVLVATDRPHVSGVIVVSVDEHFGLPGQHGPDVIIAPYLRASDGKPIEVVMGISGLTNMTVYGNGKLKRFPGALVLYARTRYSRSTITAVARTKTADQMQQAMLVGVGIEAQLRRESNQDLGSGSAVARQGFWVNVGTFAVLTDDPQAPANSFPGLARSYPPQFQVREAVKNVPTNGLALATSLGPAPTVSVGEFNWYVQDPSNPFSANATYIDLSKQDQSNTNEFLAGVFIGVAGGAAIAALQELPKKKRPLTSPREDNVQASDGNDSDPDRSVEDKSDESVD